MCCLESRSQIPFMIVGFVKTKYSNTGRLAAILDDLQRATLPATSHDGWMKEWTRHMKTAFIQL